MARSIWTGAISFGLVTVPVKLYSAVIRKTVRFHQLNESDRRRASSRSASTPRPARRSPYEDIVKGYEIAPDRYVVIEPERARGARPEEDEDHRDRGLRRPRRDRPDLLRPPVLPGARRRAAPSPTGCCSRRCARPTRSAIAKVVIRSEGEPRRDAPDGGDVLGHGDDDLRRRGRRPRAHRRPARPRRRRGQRPRAGDRQAARRVAGRATSSPTSTTTPTARRSSR